MEETFDPSYTYPRHTRAHQKGGIHLKEQVAKVTEIALGVLKHLGVQMKEKGVLDLVSISKPAVISYHKTYHECLGREFLQTKFLNKAAAAKNPVDRLKYVTMFLLTGIWRNPVEMQNNGPLNPVLGETYIAEKKDGTTFYCEQISHHPPVLSFLLVGPNNSYRLYSTGELEVHLNGVNHILGRRSGKTTIEFADGTKIVFTNPDTRIDGLLVGDRRYNYVKACVFLDKTHKISAEVNFLYEHVGTISRMTNGIKKLFGSHHEHHRSDEVEIVFFKYDKENGGDAKKEVLLEGSGSWASHFQVGGKVLWRVDEPFDDWWIESMHHRLLSDSLFREDAKYIKIKDFDKAQKAKDELENRQRNDEKLRKEYRAGKYKPK